jgi:hypothetical protein
MSCARCSFLQTVEHGLDMVLELICVLIEDSLFLIINTRIVKDLYDVVLKLLACLILALAELLLDLGEIYNHGNDVG